MNLIEKDALVVGAGFAGMYMVYLLRNADFDVQGVERASDVGGTWYWNRYPGCRCDVESIEYSYQFDQALQEEWVWTERYASQPEILSYAQHVAERFDLKRSILFETEVSEATFDEVDHRWRVTTSGDTFSVRYLIMATGCLSSANVPNFPGLDDFSGRIIHTGLWPQEGAHFDGRRVGIIGTGSSGIQSIPHIASEADHLTVFQRTANFSVPAQNRPVDPEEVARIKRDYPAFRELARQQPAAFGPYYPRNPDSVFDASPEDRRARFEAHWQLGGFMFLGAFGDLHASEEANWHAAEFVRDKIRATVNDPETAEKLCPTGVIGCKRLCADTGYFETYNRNNVQLVDLRENPIERITSSGLIAGGEAHAFDDLVLATGFDAMTGSLLKIDVRGRSGLALAEKWAAGPRTYLGLMTTGFPNFFTMTGPGSPSVLANMVTGVEQHAEYIIEMIQWAQTKKRTTIEPEQQAEDDWVNVVNARSELTLYPRCNSWYLGANIPGKPRVFMPFLGFPDYSVKLQEVSASDFSGFELR